MQLRVIDGAEVGVERCTIVVVVGRCLHAAARILVRDAAGLVVRVGQESTLCRTPPLTYTSRMVLQVF